MRVRTMLVLIGLACLFPAGAAAEELRLKTHDADGTVLNSLPQPQNSPVDIEITGTATTLGKFTARGQHVWFWLGDSSVFVEIGEITITAANGDKLYGDYMLFFPLTSRQQAPPFYGQGIVLFSGGTGRFADVSGGAEAWVVDPNTGEFSVSLDGVLWVPGKD